MQNRLQVIVVVSLYWLYFGTCTISKSRQNAKQMIQCLIYSITQCCAFHLFAVWIKAHQGKREISVALCIVISNYQELCMFMTKCNVLNTVMTHFIINIKNLLTISQNKHIFLSPVESGSFHFLSIRLLIVNHSQQMPDTAPQGSGGMPTNLDLSSEGTTHRVASQLANVTARRLSEGFSV